MCPGQKLEIAKFLAILCVQNNWQIFEFALVQPVSQLLALEN